MQVAAASNLPALLKFSSIASSSEMPVSRLSEWQIVQFATAIVSILSFQCCKNEKLVSSLTYMSEQKWCRTNSKCRENIKFKANSYGGYKRSQRKLISDICLAICKFMKVTKPKNKHKQMHVHTQMWTLRLLNPWWNFSSQHLFPFHPSHSSSRITFNWKSSGMHTGTCCNVSAPVYRCTCTDADLC